MEFKAEHLFYFDSRTLESLLVRAGFDEVAIDSGRKTLSPDYVIAHFERFPVPVISPLGTLAKGAARRCCGSSVDAWSPAASTCWRTRLPKAPVDRRQAKLSVIMPVFNERSTFPTSSTQLTAKQIPGVEIEFVIVESNSTDGTRDEVAQVRGPPGREGDLRGAPARQGPRASAPAWRRDRRLRPDPGRRPRVRPQRLRDPARAAARRTARRSCSARVTAWTARPGRCGTSPTRCSSARCMNLGHVFFTGLFNVVYGHAPARSVHDVQGVPPRLPPRPDVRVEPLRLRLGAGRQAGARGLPARSRFR